MWPFKQHKLPRAIQVTPAGVLRWGPLTFEECARIGIEAFMGLVSDIHEDCTRHWWCTPVRRDLAKGIQLAYADHPPNGGPDDYILVSQFSADSRPIDPRMVLETTLNPMSDGRVLVNKASLRPFYKPAIVVPRPVGHIPADPEPGPPIFHVVRSNGTWEVFRVIYGAEGKDVQLAQVASLPPL